ncbi:MAG: ABC transporter permease subunit [Oscillospiraceae bacterium]
MVERPVHQHEPYRFLQLFLPAQIRHRFVRGIEYTLLLAVVSVLLAILPALGLALMRLSRKKPVRWLSGAYIAVFRSTPCWCSCPSSTTACSTPSPCPG